MAKFFEPEDVKNAGIFQKWCVIPVLGLLENSLYDSILLHNSFCLVLQIINSCSKVADMLLDNGLLYALCNTLAALNGLETSILSSDYRLLVCDIQQLIVAVTIHACSSSGSQYFRIIEDLMVLLGYLQNSKNKRTQNMAIALQFRVLQAAVEFIKTTANQDTEDLSSSFHSPISHHQAIFQKRKSIAGRKYSLARSDSLLMRMRVLASDELSLMMQRRMSQENPIRATEAELMQRLQRLTVLAANRFLYKEFTEDCFDMLDMSEATVQDRIPVPQIEQTEEMYQQEQPKNKNIFMQEMFKIMIEGIGLSVGTNRPAAPTPQWKRILLSCKDTFRVQLGRLLVHALYSGTLFPRKEANPGNITCNKSPGNTAETV
ncbi:UNVERIFIED_CONTAM: hypothetical protein K2H54_059139 [Gekko kuhli]